MRLAAGTSRGSYSAPLTPEPLSGGEGGAKGEKRVGNRGRNGKRKDGVVKTNAAFVAAHHSGHETARR